MKIQRIEGNSRVAVDCDAETLPEIVAESASKLSLELAHDRGDASVIESIALGPHYKRARKTCARCGRILDDLGAGHLLHLAAGDVVHVEIRHVHALRNGLAAR